MPSMLFYGQSGILCHLFRSYSLPKPSTIAVALCTKIPSDQDTGATISEPSMANNYARVNLGAPADATWTQPAIDSIQSGYILNNSLISFPSCLNADWGWISGIAICDSQGVGSGNCIYGGPIPVAQLVQVGTTFQIASGNFKIAAH